MSIKITIPNSSSDVLTFGSGNTPTAAQIAGIDSGSSNGQLALYTTASGTSTERVRVDASGNVGIGTSSPLTPLHVVGAIQSQRTGGVSQYARMVNSGGTATFISDNQASGTYTGFEFQGLSTASGTPTTYATIDGSGNLLVGTTSANARLTVNGIDATASNNSFIARNSSNTILIQARNDGFVFLPTTYNNTLGVSANLFVNTDGSLSRATSSAKYKREIVDARFGLNDALKLRPVNYKDKSTDSETLYGGLIAEEVHEAGLTEFVYYAEDGTPDALHYGNMVSLCIKAIQEQQAIITSLTDRITALENK